MTWGAAQLGIGQGVLDAVADGLIEATGDLLVLVAVWVDPAPTTRRPSARRTARRRARRSASASSGRDPAAAARARRAARHAQQPVLRRRVSADRRDRDAATTATRSTRRSAPPGIPSRGRTRTRRSSSSAPTTGSRATRAATRLPDRELLERLLVGVDPRPHRGRARDLRDRRLPRRPALDASRSRSGISSAARSDEPLWQLLGGALGADPRLRLERRARRAGRARRAAASRCATAACARSSSASTRPTGATTSPWSRPCATPSARSSRSWSTRTRAGGCPATSTPRWDVATARAVRARARAARRLLARGAAPHGRRRRLRGARAQQRRCASPRARWCARRPRRATSSCAAASTSSSRTSCSRGGIGGLPADRRARRPSTGVRGARTRGRTATACSRTSTPRSRSRRARTSRCRSTRRPGRPSGATGCSRCTLEIAARRDDRAARRARARRRARLRRARAVPGRLMRIRAAVLRRAGSAASRSRRSSSTRRRRARCSCASPPPASATPTSASPTASSATGRWPMVLGHEGAGVVEAVGEGVTHVAPGDHVALLLRPRLPRVPDCLAGRLQPLRARGRERPARGCSWTGRPGSRLPDGTTLQHGLMTACFAERTVVAAAGAVPLPPELPLWQAALLGCGVVTGVRRGAQRRAGAAGRERRRDRLRRRRPAGDRGRPARRRRADRRRRPRPGEARARARARRDARRRARLGDDRRPRASAHRRRRRPRVRGRRPAGDDPARLGRPPPGGTAVVVGLAPSGVEVSLPAIEFLSDKGLRGSYYGSGDPPPSCPGSPSSRCRASSTSPAS